MNKILIIFSIYVFLNPDEEIDGRLSRGVQPFSEKLIERDSGNNLLSGILKFVYYHNNF